MNVVQINTDFVRVGQVTLSTGEFYTLRPAAPRLPAWATMLRHERDALTYVSDGKTQREYTGDVGQLEALLDDQAALAADLATLREPPAPSLDERRAQATLLIDGAAERARLAFITAGSGQALVYELVRLQAADYAAHYTVENPPAVGIYPLLEAQIGTVVPDTSDFASDIADAAAVVATTAQAWTRGDRARPARRQACGRTRCRCGGDRCRRRRVEVAAAVGLDKMTQSSSLGAVATGTGAVVRAAFNSADQALATESEGHSAPSTTYPFMLWRDDTAKLVYRRNAANEAGVSAQRRQRSWCIGATPPTMTGRSSRITALPSIRRSTKTAATAGCAARSGSTPAATSCSSAPTPLPDRPSGRS